MIRFSVSGQVETPVPTVFLKKYMGDAPPKYVKVYLYGLYLSHTGEQPDIVELEETLHLTASEIESGLEYWQKKGLLNVRNTARGASYEFLTAEAEATEEKAAKKPPLYEYEGYNNMLSTLLRRTLSVSDLQKIYDFTDVYGLPQDVVITMIEHCVNARGASVSVVYLDKVAQAWAEEGVFSREEAQQKTEEYRTVSSGARIVMKQMGAAGKLPGQTERDFYNKWTEKWGFTQESILFAMKDVEFGSKDNPFKYLDGILRNLYEQGLTSSRKIGEYNAAYTRKQGNIKEVLTTLDFRSKAVTPRHEKIYEKWEEAGFSHAIILLACEQAKESGMRGLQAVDAMLNEWRELGLSDEDAIRKYMRQQNTLDKKVKQVYDNAGIRRPVDEKDRAWYLNLTKEQKMSHDVLMYAAEFSSMAVDPLRYLRKVLSSWAEAGVRTLDAARGQNLARFADDLKGKKAFPQHAYTAEEVERQEQGALDRLEQMYGK